MRTSVPLAPGNILLTKSGVKVLDFGLAKITHAAAVGSPGLVETQAVSLTAEGSLLGTLPYMSPEQVEGHDADARSDIFASIWNRGFRRAREANRHRL